MVSTIEAEARKLAAAAQEPELLGREFMPRKMLAGLIKAVHDANENPEDDAMWRARAQRFHRDGELEIDDDAIVSVSEDCGAYVAAWVWVEGEEEDRERDECDDCGYETSEFVVCPDGAEICPDCFDAGHH